jgi:hypothetical protein
MQSFNTRPVAIKPTTLRQLTFRLPTAAAAAVQPAAAPVQPAAAPVQPAAAPVQPAAAPVQPAAAPVPAGHVNSGLVATGVALVPGTTEVLPSKVTEELQKSHRPIRKELLTSANEQDILNKYKGGQVGEDAAMIRVNTFRKDALGEGFGIRKPQELAGLFTGLDLNKGTRVQVVVRLPQNRGSYIIRGRIAEVKKNSPVMDGSGILYSVIPFGVFNPNGTHAPAVIKEDFLPIRIGSLPLTYWVGIYFNMQHAKVIITTRIMTMNDLENHMRQAEEVADITVLSEYQVTQVDVDTGKPLTVDPNSPGDRDTSSEADRLRRLARENRIETGGRMDSTMRKSLFGQVDASDRSRLRDDMRRKSGQVSAVKVLRDRNRGRGRDIRDRGSDRRDGDKDDGGDVEDLGLRGKSASSSRRGSDRRDRNKDDGDDVEDLDLGISGKSASSSRRGVLNKGMSRVDFLRSVRSIRQDQLGVGNSGVRRKTTKPKSLGFLAIQS